MTWEEKIFIRYQKGVFFTINQMVKYENETEDLMLDGFAKAFKHINTYNQKVAFSTWLYRIVIKNVVLNIRRKRLENKRIDYKKMKKNNNNTYAEDLLSDLFDPELMLTNAKKTEAIDSITKKLSPNYQALIKCRFKDNLSYQDISTKLGIEIHTVRKKLEKARNFITAILESNYKHNPNIKN